tara:strand:+ start:270 stop:833 length:564 start_codon:yes stop_codon:yes gene_type:complete
MNNQKIFIYDSLIIHEILSEIKENLNFNISHIKKDELDTININENENYIFLTQKKIPNIKNQFILDNLPIRLSQLIEKLNVEFLKLNFKDQASQIIGKYHIDLNARTISDKIEILKLTEKEIDTIVYLTKSKKPIKIKELQLNVWDHKSLLETHTVETHIHRLRKKIKEKFKDDQFIISSKEGYFIS